MRYIGFRKLVYFSIVPALFLAFFQTHAFELPRIPENISEQDRIDLTALRNELLNRWSTIVSRVGSHNQQCSSVLEGSTEEASCSSAKAQIEGELKAHQDAVAGYKGKLARAQAEAAERLGKEATKSPTTEEAKKKAGECFDKGCALKPPSSNVVDLSKMGRRPAMPEWMTKDPRYIQLDAEMTAIEKHHQEIQGRLDELGGQLSRGEGNKDNLMMQISKFKQERFNKENQMADVKRRMVDLSVQLEKEGPPEETPTQTSSGQQTKPK